MPFSDPGAIADVAAASAIDPLWGNAIRDRVVNRFATTTDRDAAITSPHEGMHAYVTADHTAYVYDGVSWRPHAWNAPWGIVGKAAITTAQSGLSAATDLTSLTVTFTAVANRQYKVVARVSVTKHTAGDAILIVADGSSVEKTRARVTLADAAVGELTIPGFLETYTAGSVTRKLRLQASAGTVDSSATNSSQVFIFVEDVGSAGTPT